MTEHAFLAAVMIAFLCFVGFVCWLIARYGGTRNTEKRTPHYTRTTITFEPREGIETAPTRSPKPVLPPQPNRRKKKKSKNKR